MTDRQKFSSRPASLTTRVTVFVGITTTLCLIVLGFIVQRSIEAHFLQQDASELQVVAETVRTILSSSGSDTNSAELQSMLSGAVSGHHAVFFLVADQNGSVVYATPGPDLSEIAQSQTRVARIDAQNIYSWTTEGVTYRGAAITLQPSPNTSNSNLLQINTLVVAISMDFHLEFMNSFYRNLWGVVIGICLFSILAAWMSVHQGHAPLRKVSSQIRDISSDKLHLRVDTNQVPIELVDLVSAFNDMLQRIEDEFNKLSHFSADIAHELRTPITNIMTQTQVSLGQVRSTEEYQEILYSNLEEYEHMAAMINDMLMLAKTESGLLEPAFSELDVAAEIEGLFDFFEAWSEENNIRLELTGESAPIHCDRAMVRRALSNLLSNAIRHATKDSIVRVLLKTDAGVSQIIVENTGATIPPEQASMIFDRFYRGDPSRQRRGDGAGLGLAIVKSIVDVHGWKITVNSADGLTQFVLEIPS